MSKKKKIILAVVIIVAIAAVSVGFFLKGKLGKAVAVEMQPMWSPYSLW